MISKLENMDYERGASRAVTWLACAALAVVLAICLLAAGGCASILDSIGDADIEKLDALAEKWKAKLEEKIGGTVETPTPDVPTPGTPSSTIAATTATSTRSRRRSRWIC